MKAKMMFLGAAMIIFAVGAQAFDLGGNAEDLNKALTTITRSIVGGIKGGPVKRIGVAEFSPSGGAALKLGPYLSDKLTGNLSDTKSVEIIERAKLSVLVEEMALNQTGLVDPKSAQEVGNILGVQAFVVGSYTLLGNKAEVNVRLVSTETAKVLATVSVQFKKTSETEKLFEPLVPKAPIQLEASVLAQRKTERGYEAIMVEDGGTLYSNDNFKIYFRVNEDCYVYVLMFDSKGKASQIFPSADISMSNRIEGKRDYRIPTGVDWFYLDNNTGVETIYVIAAYEPMNDLTKLLMDMERAGEAEQAEASKKIEERISTRGIGGVRPGVAISYDTTDGKKIEKVTQKVEGKVSAVRKISFKHK